MKRLWFVVAAVVMAAIGACYILVNGNEFELHKKLSEFGGRSNHFVGICEEDSEGEVEILGCEVEGDELIVRMKSVRKGRVFLQVIEHPAGTDGLNMTYLIVYVHASGVITYEDYFGECTGSRLMQVLIAIYLAALLVAMIIKFRNSVRENMYRYRNILYAGLIIFLVFALLSQVRGAISGGGLIVALRQAMNTMASLVLFTFPIVILTTISVFVSNIRLMIKEGFGWRNMLASILAIVLGFGSLLPFFLNSFFQQTTLIDVHRWTGIGRFVETFSENVVYSLVAYLECILFGTIFLGVRAAKHVPAFDKDYILIHGCRLRSDGTLTKLLQARADRAVEFAKIQKEKTGRDITFIPSGGKGDDEIVSEAEAIRRYLTENGVPEEQILLEDRSLNTEQNLRNSLELISENAPADGADAASPKVAFSTTNYHVLRAGLLATEQGFRLEGIGAKTRSYFWINAFVREFIATIVKERKRHAIVVGGLVLLNLLLVVLEYISNVVLS